MPFYEYECTKCSYHKEILQKITDKPLVKCEKCNGKMKKLISATSFHLKGSGWYVTDYASKNGSCASKPSTKDSSSSSETTSETPKEAKAAEDKPAKNASSGTKKTSKEKA
jgi:putative FmdB family regulatory protein